LQVQRAIPDTSKEGCDFSDVLITDELWNRPPAKTDYLREKLALQDLALQMADHPAEVLPASSPWRWNFAMRTRPA
jgi:hypothetical protein